MPNVSSRGITDLSVSVPKRVPRSDLQYAVQIGGPTTVTANSPRPLVKERDEQDFAITDPVSELRSPVRLCAHGRRFRAFSKTFSSLLSFWRPVYTDQGKIFSIYWISSNFCSKLLVFASVFAWKHKWKRSKTLPCARSLRIISYWSSVTTGGNLN